LTDDGCQYVYSVIQLVFETTVPEEILIVKFLSVKRKYKKKTVEPDGDSDEEAQQLIDEAENEAEAITLSGMTIDWCVRLWDSSRIWIHDHFPKCFGCMFVKFLGEVGLRIRNIPLDFVTDPFPDQELDLESVFPLFQH